MSFGMTDYSNSNDCSFTGAEFGLGLLKGKRAARPCGVAVIA